MKFGREEGWKEIDFSDILTRQELIDRMFNEFEKDKKTIKENIMKYLNEVYLETNNEEGKLSVTIKYERKYADGQKYSKSKNN